MKIITYLAFTMLSIAMQFVVMDFINEKIKTNDDNVDLNVTSPKKRFKEILRQYANKPHALYYRYPGGRLEKGASKAFTNSSIQEITLESSTDISSTMFDILYDENVTTTEDSYTEPTDAFYTSTEFDNVTEITLFGKKNKSTDIKIVPKKTMSKDCNCNLLYKVCDINCCCDNDCTEADRKVFVCTTSALNTVQNDQSCSSPFPYSSYSIGANIDTLFCVAKSNLPEKRNIVHDKHDPSVLNKCFKWHENSKPKNVEEFTKAQYKYDDPIWLLKNGSIYYVDMPATLMNNYCNGRKPIRFLKQQNTKCNVKVSDLEILQILSTVEGTSVISVTENTFNTSTLNCSTLHCTNWTIQLCDDSICTKYNKSLHDPLCTENHCTHLALKVDYTFHYYDSKIMNATVTLHTQRVPLNIPFIEQEVNVKFVIANESTEQIIEFSGSPGYINGLPVIVSYSEGNHTDNFFNESSKLKKYLPHPENENGACNQNSKTNNFILFGINKRIKCRYYQTKNLQKKNGTELCKNIQKGINRLLGIGDKVTVSPLGNPYDIKDEKWIELKIDNPETLLYGQFNTQKTRLDCYNLITRFFFIFTFADTSDGTTKSKKTILSARVGVTPANVTLRVEDVSCVLTVDSSFVDETAPAALEYAGAPQLNIHLPKDFFFPFPSNTATSYVCYVYLMMFCLVLLVNK